MRLGTLLVMMEPNIENITLNEYLMNKGRHRDLAKSYTSRKKVAPERNRGLVYLDSDEDREEYCWLPPLLSCFQTPQPCTIFNPIHHNSRKEDTTHGFTSQFQSPQKPNPPLDKKDSNFEKILNDLLRIRAENLRRMEHEVLNRCDDKTVGNIDHEDGDQENEDILNFPIFLVTNEFASVCEQDVDNINDNTAREEEEDEVKVEKQEEPDEEVASTLVQVFDGMNDVMQPLKEFVEELLDITMVDKKVDCNLIMDIKEFPCIVKTYAESETLIQPSLHMGSQSLKLSTKTGMKWKERISPLRYNFNLSFPYPTAKLLRPGVYCYFHPHLISNCNYGVAADPSYAVVNELCGYVHWKPSRDFTRPLGPPSGLKGLLHTLIATVIPMKVDMEHRLEAASKHFKSKVVECYANGDDEFLVMMDFARGTGDVLIYSL
ncbi:hypothetical protein Tco_0751662 [Tanacetum coccineum]|uniref:Uncharacterized protein n=1 Tax=Tanacetum coccineum TaxID=301880 RepID=A0ABQ4Z691_9ASTR